VAIADLIIYDTREKKIENMHPNSGGIGDCPHPLKE
jgi:hypothetical protein